MVEPIRQLFGEDVYMHQFKINGKAGLRRRRLAVAPGLRHLARRRPDARGAGDERRHLPRRGERVQRPADVHSRQPQARRARRRRTTRARPAIRLWVINHDTISKLVERGGIVAPKGPAGSMILFHGCLVHASTSNLSPWNRVSVYLSLCAVSNHIRRFKRPGYIAHRDFTPIRSPARRLPAQGLRRGASLEGRHAARGAAGHPQSRVT